MTNEYLERCMDQWYGYAYRCVKEYRSRGIFSLDFVCERASEENRSGEPVRRLHYRIFTEDMDADLHLLMFVSTEPDETTVRECFAAVVQGNDVVQVSNAPYTVVRHLAEVLAQHY